MNTNKYQDFLKKTEESINFYIFDVKNDNACFYRTIINCLFKIKIKNNKLNEFFENIQINQLDDNLEDFFSKKLQNDIFNWVQNNLNFFLNEYNLTLKELILITHECTIDEYLERYKVFAGEDKDNIDDRWGSIVEQIAVSELFDLKLNIYTSQKYDYNKNKIITGKIIKNKAEINVRFKQIQIIGNKYNDEINLLWKKYNKKGHYMCLIKKNFI